MEEKIALLRELLEPDNQHEMVAAARALCTFAEAATDTTMLLCIALVEAKGDAKAVQEVFGLRNFDIRRHTQSAMAGRIMRQLAKEKLSSSGYIKALAALEDVAGSESSSGTSRRNAAQAIVEMVNEDQNGANNNADGGIDLNVMTLAQLQAFVGAIKAELLQSAPQPPLIEG